METLPEITMGAKARRVVFKSFRDSPVGSKWYALSERITQWEAASAGQPQLCEGDLSYVSGGRSWPGGSEAGTCSEEEEDGKTCTACRRCWQR